MKTIMQNRSQWAIFFAMAFVMVATRYHHFGTALHMPDASLAIFFLAGFYLRPLIFFVLLFALGGGIDYYAITKGGVSDFCVTPAYAFLLPTYAVMWYAGRYYAGRHKMALSSLPLFAVSAVLSSLLAFLISNGGFYWFSGRFPDMSLAEYSARVAKYLWPYVSASIFYIGLAALVHVAAHVLSGLKSDADQSV